MGFEQHAINRAKRWTRSQPPGVTPPRHIGEKLDVLREKEPEVWVAWVTGEEQANG